MMKKLLLLILIVCLCTLSKAQTLLSESFEGSFPPTGWLLVNNSSGNNWTQNTSATYSSSGTKSMQYIYHATNAADAWAFSPALNFTNGTSYRISYFYRVRSASYVERLKVTIGNAQTVAAATTILVDHSSLTNSTYAESVVNYSATSTGTYYLGFNCYSIANQWNLYVDSVVVQQLSACTGTPNAGTVAGASSVCSNVNFTLTATGYTTGIAGVTYRWQSSPNGTTWTNTSGTNPASFTTSQTANTYYRLVDTCTNSGQSAVSNSLQVTTMLPTYATLPFTESFEPAWIDGCGATGSISTPNASWINTPTSGNNSWRRNDAPTSASGWSSTSGSYSPAFSDGSYSARFHSYDASAGTSGTLDLYLDCSTGLSSKEMTFDYINTSGSDSLVVYVSTNNGTSFIRLDSLKTRAAWSSKTINFTSNSATTIIRFKAISDFGTTDIGLDNISISSLTGCTGTPDAGTVTTTSSSACSGIPFTLTASGYTTGVAGVTYRWQSSSNGTTWTNTSGTDPASFTTSQTADTYYRLVDTCTTSGQSAVSGSIQVTTIVPTYATLPFTESFETTWSDGCGATGSQSIPNANWLNNPVSGNTSWRRNDEIVANSGWGSTSGSYTPAFSDGTYSARFHSYGAQAGTSGTLDLHLDCSTGQATKQMTFDYINTSGNDSLIIYVSTNSGTSFTRLDSLKTRAAWSSKTIDFTSNSATTIIRFKAISDFGATDIGLDNINIITLNNCSGTPTAGTITSTATSLCANINFTLSATGHTAGVAGITYRWQSSPNGTTWSNTTGTDPTSFTTAITASTYYRLVDTCTISGQSAVSNSIQITILSPDYATLPFTEGFENTWIDGCAAVGNQSIPSNSWRNEPTRGNNSWRRNDETTANSGWSSTSGSYTPVSSEGSYSARFHSYSTGSTTPGYFDLYLNCSTGSADKQMTFDYINTSGSDSLVVYVSTNNGTSFTRLDSLKTRAAWSNKVINFTSNSATTIIRFKAIGDFGSTDIGLDNVNVITLTTCSGTPTAGTISGSSEACSGVGFVITASGYTAAVSGITYRWQTSPDGTNWSNTTGADPASFTATQTATTYYRLVDTCTISGQSAISNTLQVTMKLPTDCYCTPAITNSCTSFNDHIATFKFGALKNENSGCNGNANSYINYATTSFTGTFAKGVSYGDTLVSGTGSGTHGAGVWIDFNKNGAFNDAGEFFLFSNTIAASATVTSNILIPTTASTGTTRMRVRYIYLATLDSSFSCSSHSYGETEDYTITIAEALPVSLYSFVGEKQGSYNLLNWSTKTEQNNVGFELQRSADGINFSAITFVNSKAENGNSNQNLNYSFTDVKALSNTCYYRLKQIDKDGKFSLSNIVVIKGMKPSRLEISSVYPNPAVNEISVSLVAPKNDNITLVISDITGKIIAKFNKSIIIGDNNLKINVSNLSSGSYTIKAICQDGCETSVSKFIKQ